MNYQEELKRRRTQIQDLECEWSKARDTLFTCQGKAQDARLSLRKAQEADEQAQASLATAKGQLDIRRASWDSVRQALGQFVVQYSEAEEDRIALAQPPAIVGTVEAFAKFLQATGAFGNLGPADFRRALMNVGVDVTCGSCAMLFFTGGSSLAHTCAKKVP